MMPARGFAGMTIEGLIELRDQVATHLAKRRLQLEAEIERIAGSAALRRGRPPGSGGRALKGRKVPPKYRGPKGETWAGRGATPVWIVALMKQGRKKEEFAINKNTAVQKRAATKVKRRAMKRSRRRKK
jgi:DNA-binding protein H-NS